MQGRQLEAGSEASWQRPPNSAVMPMVCAVYGYSDHFLIKSQLSPKNNSTQRAEVQKTPRETGADMIKKIHLKSFGTESDNARICSDRFTEGKAKVILLPI